MWTMKCLLMATIGLTFLQGSQATISQEFKNSTNQFNLNLLRAVLQSSGNVVVSPVSVAVLIAILQQGSHGTSKQEITSVLLTEPQETKQAYGNITNKFKQEFGRTELEFSTRAFAAENFHLKEDFKKLLADIFQSNIDSMNFSNPENATNSINSWVSESTHQRITQLFQPTDLSPNTALVLANAIYFHGFWENAFYGSGILNKAFSPKSGEEIQVPTLSQVEIYKAGECLQIGIKFVHLELKDTDEFTVMLVLPTQRHGLDRLVERMTAENLTNIISHQGLKNVSLSFPKFRLRSESQLKPLLQQLGIRKVFEDNADLSGITNDRIKVSKVIQKAEIQADENGVTASAATGMTFTYLSGTSYPPVEDMEFIADHPFLFFIVDRTYHVPLFAGRVTNPSV